MLAGGGQPDKLDLAGAPYFEPTILTDLDHAAACEENFGPGHTVFGWFDRDDVIERANDTEYGLASGVWTSDLETAHEAAADIEAGTVWIDTYNDLLENVPHGDYEQGGIGRELAGEAFEDYRQTRTVVCNFGDLPKLG